MLKRLCLAIGLVGFVTACARPPAPPLPLTGMGEWQAYYWLKAHYWNPHTDLVKASDDSWNGNAWYYWNYPSADYAVKVYAYPPYTISCTPPCSSCNWPCS